MFDTKYEKMSDLEKRVYTSRLLGSDDSLVLHGGGNTSVKTTIKDIDGKRAFHSADKSYKEAKALIK